eukprot:1853889-Pleurochrysis_carterae.AAC.1
MVQPDWNDDYGDSASDSYDDSRPASDTDSPTRRKKRAQYHAAIDEAIHRKEVADGERILRERHDEAVRLRALGLQRNLCTDQ